MHQAPMTRVGRTLGKVVFAALGGVASHTAAGRGGGVEGMGSAAGVEMAAACGLDKGWVGVGEGKEERFYFFP